MIAYDGVTIRYGSAVDAAVTDVGFTALRGSVTALVGPNGSGKSTIVRALLRGIVPETGSIRIDGESISGIDRISLARRVAVVTQREDSIFARSVAEYVALGRYPHRTSWTRDIGSDERAIAIATERASIAALLGRRTDELSGGEWQRVRIARALAQQGDALVLDEPTSFLDIAHEMQIFQLAAALASGGMAVVIVSHQLNLVARFADRMIMLHRGRVVASGTPVDVMRGDLLERVYNWPVVVTRDPAVNAPMLLPLRSAN